MIFATSGLGVDHSTVTRTRGGDNQLPEGIARKNKQATTPIA